MRESEILNQSLSPFGPKILPNLPESRTFDSIKNFKEMDPITLKRNKRIPYIKSKKVKRTFLALNILLLIGAIILISTLLYLLFHLNQSDKVIFKCLVSILTGMILILFYVIGYNEIKKNQNIHV
jgi:hypothetical protein